MSNHFDNLEIDIQQKNHELIQKIPHHPFGSISTFKKYIHLGLFKLKLLTKLVDSGFIRRWFSEFNFYWQKELGGRPLKFHDFFYLYSNYRAHYQSLNLTDENNPDQFLTDWQLPNNLYQTFSCAYQYAINPFSYLPFKKYLRPQQKILEYGAGFAPLTTSLAHYEPNKYHLSIADIPGFTFHYAKWKLKQLDVKAIDINPAELPTLEKYDIIFIVTVLEHLPNPLEVIKHLTNHLKPEGILIFDYIISDGDGLDTKQALTDRPNVLDFIKSNYNIIDGKIDYQRSMALTVAKKKLQTQLASKPIKY